MTHEPNPIDVARLAGQLHETADRVDGATVALMNHGDVYAAGQRLADALDTMLRAADNHRRQEAER